MSKQKLNLITASIIAVLSLNAHAGLNIYSNAVEESEDARNIGNYEFNQKGLSSEQAQIVSGFGKDMPLSLSLQIIIPNDWKVDLNEAAKNMPVNWNGKATWPYVLENLAKNSNLLVTIDWSKRVVNVFSKESEENMIAMKQKSIIESEKRKEALEIEANLVSQKAEKIAEEAAKVRKEVVIQQERVKEENIKLSKAREYAALEEKVINQVGKVDRNETNSINKKTTINQIYKNANVVPLEKTEEAFVKMRANQTLNEYDEAWYYIHKETMLSDNIAAWAEANGWSLKWEADTDFKIVDRIELKGTLIKNVDYIISLYRNSDKPLMVNMYTKNKVISIKDFNYDKQ